MAKLKYGWLQAAVHPPKKVRTATLKGLGSASYKCRHIYLAWARVSMDDHPVGHQFRCTCDKIFTVTAARRGKKTLVG